MLQGFNKADAGLWPREPCGKRVRGAGNKVIPGSFLALSVMVEVGVPIHVLTDIPTSMNCKSTASFKQ